MRRIAILIMLLLLASMASIGADWEHQNVTIDMANNTVTVWPVEDVDQLAKINESDGLPAAGPSEPEHVPNGPSYPLPEDKSPDWIAGELPQ